MESLKKVSILKIGRMIKAFYKLTIITLIAIYLVILAGSVVRMSGSGMGCPDWPKCFGQWIPPTQIDQLPADYIETFLEKRKKKLAKYQTFLQRIGLNETAEALMNDPRLLEEEPFVASKTWIEYINRLLGFMAGNFMIIGLIMSFWFFTKNKFIPLLSFLVLLFTSIQGWFGSIVVATNLTPWTITFHMLFAFIIIFLLLWLIKLAEPRQRQLDMKLRLPLLIAIGLTLLQVYLGTQVRQEIDVLSHSVAIRPIWIESLSGIFEIHRSFAIVLILVNSYIIILIRRISVWRKWSYIVASLLIVEIFSGITMAYLAVPPAMQPIHLLFSTLFFGVQSWLYLSTYRTK